VNVLFRADASDRMGTGHVMRSLTLARALQREHGLETAFVCREHPGNLIAALRRDGQPVLPLRPPDRAIGSVNNAGEDYAAWLGVPVDSDAEETIAALCGEKPEWMVVDHYGLGAEWEQRLRPHARRLMAIDDLATRSHDCDLLLDQNYSDEHATPYESRLPARCRTLLGPRYALLAPEYASLRAAQPVRTGVVRRALIYFGGVDPTNVSGEALTALSAPEFAGVEVDLVIGANHACRQALEVQAARRDRTRVHGIQASLAELMAKADVAIGAGGVTTWERLCLGLPSLVVSVAENQRPTCERLGAAGYIEYLGHAGSVGAEQIREKLHDLVESRERLMELSSRGQSLVDGRGTSRVAAALVGPSTDDLIQTRDALHRDEVTPDGFESFTFAWIDRCDPERVLAVRNQSHVIEQMRSREPVRQADHQAFLDRYGQLDRYDFILIDRDQGRYVGAFYVSNIASAPEIGKYIGDPDYLGKGIAHRAMERLVAFCRSRAGLRELTSVTRRDNQRNISLNAKLGFTPARVQGEFLVMMLDL
jgi:UDP-2,4-diacetamido-2,4,6-trideoxy-beta-L-altropyranose hydrolase